MIEFAYNNSIHSSSGFTPFYLCYGRHSVSPVNLLSQVESKNEATDSFLRQLEEDLAQALENLNRAQENRKSTQIKRGGNWNYRWVMRYCCPLGIYQCRWQQGELEVRTVVLWTLCDFGETYIGLSS